MNVQSSIIHKSQKVDNSNVHHLINKMWYIHTAQYYLSILKEEVLIHAYSMNEPQKHYAT